MSNIVSKYRVPMAALTLKQPVASAVMAGHKIFETRGFKPGKVEEFALHAGKGDSRRFQAIMGHLLPDWPSLELLPRGVLGIVRITAVFEIGVDLMEPVSDIDFHCGFWESGYAWELEVVDVFERAIPARGMPGFWQWSPVDIDSLNKF
jgi:hypothetical protein